MALAPIEGTSVTVAGAGRTDAGVHALGQVASFKLTSSIAAGDLVLALNARLPEDVRVLSAEETAEGFHARFSARAKVYRYRISNTPVLSPFQRRYAWHISRSLDLSAMKEAARELPGEHDFSCFQAAATAKAQRTLRLTTDGATTDGATNGGLTRRRRTITRSEWTEEPLAGGGRLLTYEIGGTGFLKYMVRTIIGTLVEVGDGRRAPGSIRDLLAPEIVRRPARRRRPRDCISFALITMRPVRYPSLEHVARPASGKNSQRIARRTPRPRDQFRERFRRTLPSSWTATAAGRRSATFLALKDIAPASSRCVTWSRPRRGSASRR